MKRKKRIKCENGENYKEKIIKKVKQDIERLNAKATVKIIKAIQKKKRKQRQSRLNSGLIELPRHDWSIIIYIL